jgi:hypothetical protein
VKGDRTYAEEARIHRERNTPALLFRHFGIALLLSARISAGNALEATRTLIETGLRTPQKMGQCQLAAAC